MECPHTLLYVCIISTVHVAGSEREGYGVVAQGCEDFGAAGYRLEGVTDGGIGLLRSHGCTFSLQQYPVPFINVNAVLTLR